METCIVFRRKPKEEPQPDATQSEPGGESSPGGLTPPTGLDAVLFDDLGMHQLWYLERRLKDELVRASRMNSIFSLACWRLKLLPGEEMSGDVIKKAASTIAGRLRSYDICARLDEQRFAAILFDAEYEAAATVAYRLKSDLQMQVQSMGRWQAGVASFPRDGVDGNGMIQAAFRRLEEDSRAA